MDSEYLNKDTEVVILESKSLTNSVPKRKQDRAKYLEKEKINEAISSMPIGKERTFITFLWLSGVRITEAINIKKGDIDFSNSMVTLKWLKSRKYNTRVCPLHSSLNALLMGYTQIMNKEERVFPFSRQRGFQITKKYLGCSPHQLRHSFAVNWLRSGADIITLHRILGHSKIQTTMEYLKIVPMDQQKELEKVRFW
jgi:integrase/recombinase XerD